MKKLILIILIVLLFFAGALTLSGKEESRQDRSYVEKTYFLKNVSADFVLSSLRVYISQHSAQGNILSVTIRKDKVKQFEELLKKIDVKRKRITFRIFIIIGSHEGESEKIKNKGLNNVLNELKEVLSIDVFRLDGVGSLTVLEGASRNMLSLTSKSGLKLDLLLQNISINKDNSEDRSVYFKFHLLNYIESTTSLKENGYLVAGVSKIGKNGDSLILVINAEIE